MMAENCALFAYITAIIHNFSFYNMCCRVSRNLLPCTKRSYDAINLFASIHIYVGVILNDGSPYDFDYV
jgi:hypothetical protein